jgi:hypothetical protein
LAKTICAGTPGTLTDAEVLLKCSVTWTECSATVPFAKRVPIWPELIWVNQSALSGPGVSVYGRESLAVRETTSNVSFDGLSLTSLFWAESLAQTLPSQSATPQMSVLSAQPKPPEAFFG